MVCSISWRYVGSLLSTHVLTLFGFCMASFAVENIMRCDLSSGQMIGFAPSLVFFFLLLLIASTSEPDNGRAAVITGRTARHDGSACFCYYLFYLRQNTTVKPALRPSFSQAAA